MKNKLNKSLIKISNFFNENQKKHCLIGGLAVSLISDPRFTNDLDIAIYVKNEKEIDEIIKSLSKLNYFPKTIINQTNVNLISIVRLISKDDSEDFYIDLIFNSSGIENEIINDSLVLNIDENDINVANLSSLLALKILSVDSERLQDIIDIQKLLKYATKDEMQKTIKLLKLIKKRGFNRQKDLISELNSYINK